MFGRRLRKLYKLVSAILCSCILLASVPQSVYAARVQEQVPAATTPARPAQDAQVEPESVSRPATAPATGLDKDAFSPVEQAYTPGPRLPGLAPLEAGAVSDDVAQIGWPMAKVLQQTATIHYVDDDGDCSGHVPCYVTIQAAVDAAASGDEIHVTQGTYTSTLTSDDNVVEIDEDVVLLGGWNDDFTARDPDTYVSMINGTTISGGGPFLLSQHRCVYIDGASPVIDGFYITGAGGKGNGGGIYNNAGSPAIQNNVISGNSASSFSLWWPSSYSGGGIYNVNGSSTVQNNVICQNSAGGMYSNGGGIFTRGGSPTIRNNVVCSNTVGGTGGGFYIVDGSPVIQNNIILGNSAMNGGGIYNVSGTPGVDYNDMWNNTGGDYGDVSPGAHDISANPLFVDAANDDFHLAAGSPCIDAGDPDTTLDIDFDGDPRPLGDGYDIGADEYACGTIDTPGDWWDDHYTSRQQLTLSADPPLAYSQGITNVVSVTLDTQAIITDGLMLSSGHDLRVVYRDPGTDAWHELPRHVEGINTDSTTVYFPIQDDIAAATDDYYLYYGHVDAGQPPELYPWLERESVVTISGSGTFTPTVAFTATAYAGLSPLGVSFANLTEPMAGIESYFWDFGNGATSAAQAPPPQTYTASGAYTVSLRVTTDEGLEITYALVNGIQVAGVDASDQIDSVTLGQREEPTVVARICAGEPEPQSFSSPDGRQTFVFPPEAVEHTMVVTYTPHRITVPQSRDHLRRFELVAEREDTGDPVETFAAPISLTLDYAGLGVEPGEEETILFFYWDEGGEEWTPITTTVDVGSSVARAEVDHLTDFAVHKNYGLGGPPQMPVQAPPGMGSGVDLLTGAATYAYPLEVPPGTHGMQPDLALVYNSSLADTEIGEQAGVVGHGWSLAGVGSIQVGGDGEFYLTLNGVSAKLVAGGCFGSPPNPETLVQCYHTERETFWRIELHEDGQNGGYFPFGEEMIPSPYWIITTQDGTRYQFGWDRDSTGMFLYLTKPVPYVYRLDQVEDTYDNRMSLGYERESDIRWGDEPYEVDRAVYLTTITYRAANEPASSRTVTLDYALPDPAHDVGNRVDRPDAKEYGPGQRYVLDEALQTITMSMGSDVRSYELGYQYYTNDDDGSGYGDLPSSTGPRYYHLMLESIAERGKDGGELPATSFFYGTKGHLAWAFNGYGGSVSYSYEEVAWEDKEDTARMRAIYRSVSGGDVIDPDQGFGMPSTRLYHYSPAVLDRDGRFLGHPEVTVDMPAGSTSWSGARYHFIAGDNPAQGNLQKVQALDRDGNVLRTVFHEYDRKINDPVEGVNTILPERTFTYVGDYSAVRSRIYYEYDSYGNVYKVSSHGNTAEGPPLNAYTTFTYVPDTTHWVINRPLSIVVSEDESASVVASRTEFEYPDMYGGVAPMRVVVTRFAEQAGIEDLETTYTYDSYGNVETVTVDDGAPTTIAYDAIYHTYPLETCADGLCDTVEYYGVDEPNGCPATGAYPGAVCRTWGPNGEETGDTYRYDQYGRVDTVDLAGGATPDVDYEYDDSEVSGSWPRVKVHYWDPLAPDDDRSYWYYYNGVGQLTQESYERSYGEMIHTAYQYDNLGQLLQVSDPFDGAAPTNWAQTFTYDDLGRPDTVLTSQSGLTDYTYDDAARTVDVMNANFDTTRYTYDDWGRVREVDPPGEDESTAYDYDILGRLTLITDPDENETAITYDGLGRKIEMIDPDMSWQMDTSWRYRYDGRGNLVKQQDARNQAICFYHDGLNRPVGKTYHEEVADIDAWVCPGEPYDVTYAYDEGTYGKGRRTGMSTSSDGGAIATSSAWVYDERGQVIEETKIVDGDEYTTVFDYDAAGRLEVLTYPDGEVVTHTYDDGTGMLAGMQSDLDGEPVYLSDAQYNILGQAEGMILGGVLPVVYDYHPQNHLLAGITVGSAGDLLDVNYPSRSEGGYDGVGNLTQVTYAGWDSGSDLTLDYTYDMVNRLGAVSGSNGESHLYAYSSTTGNLAQKDNLTPVYDEDAPPHAPVGVTDVVSGEDIASYIYDQNGNTVVKTVNLGPVGQPVVFTYDVENRITAVFSDTPAGSVTAHFAYDGDGQRVSRTVPQVCSEGMAAPPKESLTRYVGAHYEVTSGWGKNAALYTEAGWVYDYPDMVNDADGKLYLVWFGVYGEENTGTLYFATRDADGEWSTPEEVASGIEDPDDEIKPVVSVDPDDNTITVAWAEYDAGMYNYDIHVVQQDGGGGWGTQHVLGGADDDIRPSLASASDGTAYLAWYSDDGIVHVVSSGSWTEEYATGGGQYAPSLAADSQGNVYLVYVEWGEGLYLVQRSSGAGWGQPEQITGDMCLQPVAVTDVQDNVYVSCEEIWRREAGGTTWVSLGWGGTSNLVVDAEGTPHWVEDFGAGDAPRMPVLDEDGKNIADCGVYGAVNPTIAIGPDGILVVVWRGLVVTYKTDITTKHYYANGQRIATRVDDSLYYIASDHLGSTSLVVAEDGTPLTRSRYDPFGSVVETQVCSGGTPGSCSGWVPLDPTQAITQTDYLYLGDHLERELSIYFTADGRYYDPWLGKYLQPDAIGGPPLIPQAADRYQVAGNSPTGVGYVGGAMPALVVAGTESMLSNSLSAAVDQAGWFRFLLHRFSPSTGSRWVHIVGPGHSVKSAQWMLWFLTSSKSTGRELAEGTLKEWSGSVWIDSQARRWIKVLSTRHGFKITSKTLWQTGSKRLGLTVGDIVGGAATDFVVGGLWQAVGDVWGHPEVLNDPSLLMMRSFAGAFSNTTTGLMGLSIAAGGVLAAEAALAVFGITIAAPVAPIIVIGGVIATVVIEVYTPIGPAVENLWFEAFDAHAPWEAPLNLRPLTGAAP